MIVHVDDLRTDLPADNQPVLLVCRNKFNGKLYWTQAQYYAQYMLPLHYDSYGGEVCPRDGEEYAVADWYEADVDEDRYWAVTDEVIGWVAVELRQAEEK